MAYWDQNENDRSWQKVDRIYWEPETGAVWFTPDGEGRIYFDSIAEAQEETGIETPVIVLG